MPTRYETRQRIRRLNALDLEHSNYDTIKILIRRLTTGVSSILGLTSSAEIYYRVRTNPSTKPIKITELSAPPSHLVKGFQRCNGPREPMFYAASRRSTALLEARVKNNDKVYLSQWLGKDKLPFNRFFDPHLTDDLQEQIADISGEIQTFFETLFTRRIHETFSDDYKLTAAITSVMTNEFHESDRLKINSDRTVAMRYPSVAARNGSYNTVMHPQFASERLSLLHVMEVEIVEAHNGVFSGVVLDNGYKFAGDDIEWSGNAKQYPKFADNNGITFLNDGKIWHLAVNTDPYDQSQVDNLLNE